MDEQIKPDLKPQYYKEDIKLGEEKKREHILKKLLHMFCCFIMGNHNWTSDNAEGIKPSKEQLKSVGGFYNYAKMYCKNCKKESKLSVRNRIQFPMGTDLFK